MEREKLLRRIQEASFAIDEVKLFLDTHPTDRSALDYHNRYQKLRQTLVAEYTEKYGPLTADRVRTANVWTWVTQPWPWETEE